MGAAGDASANGGGMGAGVRVLRAATYLAVVVAALKLAQPLLVPIVVAAFIAIICSPAVHWLVHRHVPSGLAVLLVVILVVAAVVLVSIAVVDQLVQFSGDLPAYKKKIHEYWTTAKAWLDEHHVELAADKERDPLDPDRLLTIAGQVAGTAADALSTLFLVLLTVAFMLAEASGLRAKLLRAFDRPDAELRELDEVADQVWAYLGVKTAISLLTGLLFGLVVALAGVRYPVLWGLLAFLLNYIPNIGSLIAAIPPVLLALLDRGVGTAILVAAGNLVINNVLGNVVEPRVMGKRLGLSPLVVFLSLIFWSWVWGPIGMLLSVPLTMVVKILLEHSEDLRPIAVMLGPSDVEDAAPAGAA